MNTFISNIAKKYPALGRLIELSILSLCVYLLKSISTGVFDFNEALIAFLVPILASATKFERDIKKQIENL